MVCRSFETLARLDQRNASLFSHLQADRSPDKQYRTTPLRGLFTRQKGGFYHDGRFATLDAVVNHYNDHFDLKLSMEQKRQLVEYLKSL